MNEGRVKKKNGQKRKYKGGNSDERVRVSERMGERQEENEEIVCNDFMFRNFSFSYFPTIRKEGTK